MIIIRDKIYIDRHQWDNLPDSVRTEVISWFYRSSVSPYLCPLYSSNKFCDRYHEHGSKVCWGCSVAKNELKCYRITPKYAVFERGNHEVVEQLLELFREKPVDATVFPKLDVSMQYTFNRDLLEEPRKSEQLALVKQWVKHKRGTLVAPPRFGKTVLAALVAAATKTRVVIVIHQKELLEQFYNTFIKFTDIQAKGKILGRTLIKINPRPDETSSLSVCLYTWQQFRSKGGALKLKAIRKMFGLLIGDEIHHTGSPVYSKIVSRFYARYRLGVTATPKRKDGRHFIGNHIFGPPTVTGVSEQLPLRYTVVPTEFDVPNYKGMNNQTWNLFWTKLSKDAFRNELIVDYAAKDIRKGYKVLIPIKRIVHAKNLIGLIPDWLRPKAVVFTADIKNREQVVADIRVGKYDLVIATRQLVSEGFDAPPMSCVYLNVGSYTSDVNSLYQESARVRTQAEGKKKPLARIFSDNGYLSDRSLKLIRDEFGRLGFDEF